MVPRWVRWFVATAVLGVILLISAIHSLTGFRQSSTDDQQVLTLNELLGIAVGSALIIIAALILLTVVRNRRRERRSIERRRAWDPDYRR